ncbi:hypothetical protein ACFX2J_043091 [Malus domestica]
MANGKLIVLLLVLIFSYGIISTEERSLKTDHTKGGSTSISGDNYLNSRRSVLESELLDFVPQVLGYESAPTDNFRPTTPGHSPGAAEARLLNTTETNSAVQEPMPPPMLPPEVEPIPPALSDADNEEPPPDVTVF